VKTQLSSGFPDAWDVIGKLFIFVIIMRAREPLPPENIINKQSEASGVRAISY